MNTTLRILISVVVMCMVGGVGGLWAYFGIDAPMMLIGTLAFGGAVFISLSNA